MHPSLFTLYAKAIYNKYTIFPIKFQVYFLVVFLIHLYGCNCPLKGIYCGKQLRVFG